MSDIKELITEGLAAWSDSDSEDPEGYLQAAMSLGAKCSQCCLAGYKEGPVFSEIRPEADVLVIGEAPGKHEVMQGTPFSGPAGKELDKALGAIGRSRQEVSISNALLCRPPNNKPLNRFVKIQPKGADPVADCLERLRVDVTAADPKVIVTMGSTALKAVAKLYGIHYGDRAKRNPGDRAIVELSKQRGHPFQLPNAILMPTYHPVQALRQGRWMLGAIRRDLEKAFRYVEQGGLQFRPPDEHYVWWPELPADSLWATEIPNWVTPIHDLKVFKSKLISLYYRLQTIKALLTVDIETAGIEIDDCIRTVNFRFKDTKEVVFVIPLHFRDGSRVPDYEFFFAAIVALLQNPGGLAFQNGGFDTAHLLEKGLMKNRLTTWFDTMHFHRASEWGEGPHNLGAIMADQPTAVSDMERHKDNFLHGVGGDKET